MTCIVGLIENNTVYMGGDSMSSRGWDARTTKLKKVFKIKGFLIGYTSSFRMGQLLEHQLTITPQNGNDDMTYMVSTFVDSIRQLFKDNGYTKIDNNREEGGTFLVGYKSRLYKIGCDFQVNEFQDDFDACGCGEGYALAVMKALENLPPKERILRSLEIASYFSNGVQEPFYVLELT